MSINTKSTKAQILAAYNDLARELELTKRQLADVTTEKGILLSQLEERNQQVKLLNEEVELLKQSYDEVEAKLISVEANTFTRSEVEELIALEVADRMATKPPASQPKRPAPKPAPAQAEVAPAIQVTDADRRIWSAFKALPREKRQSYYDFSHANGYGNLGIDNIQAVREAYLAKQAA